MTTTTLAKRVHNFGAGPAALPLPVLERVQAELLDYAGTGMSVLEMSHRSAAFEAHHPEGRGGPARARRRRARPRGAVPAGRGLAPVRDAAGEPARGRSLGGLRRSPATGRRPPSRKPRSRAGRASRARPRRAGSTACRGQAELELDPQAAYLHFTSNNTIYGTQWAAAPVPPAGVPLVCDASSDALSRPLDAARYGLIYAGAQKNLGPAGVTLVVIRRELLERTPGGAAGAPRLPAAWPRAARSTTRRPASRSTSLASCSRGCASSGGSRRPASATRRRRRSSTRRSTRSDGFYRGHAQPGSRSQMNVTFRLKDDGAREGVPQRGAGRGPRRAQGPSLRRRRAGVALQRLSPRVGGGARRLHGRVPPPPRLMRA